MLGPHASGTAEIRHAGFSADARARKEDDVGRVSKPRCKLFQLHLGYTERGTTSAVRVERAGPVSPAVPAEKVGLVAELARAECPRP